MGDQIEAKLEGMFETCLSLANNLALCRGAEAFSIQPTAKRHLVITSASPHPQPEVKKNKNKKLMVDSENIPARIIYSKLGNPTKNTRSQKKI
jgi:hypothetical protein